MPNLIQNKTTRGAKGGSPKPSFGQPAMPVSPMRTYLLLRLPCPSYEVMLKKVIVESHHHKPASGTPLVTLREHGSCHR